MFNVNLLIKPASSLCNLECEYCFYSDISRRRKNYSFGFMSVETFEQIIKKAIDFTDNQLTVAFQGGEPTLVGLDFYKSVVELEKKHNKKGLIIKNSLQTNGVGLDEEWADFFRKNDFLIGISLDGIRETHNQNRCNSFNEVFKTINLFKEKGVLFNILSVVNERTAKKAQEIYSFYSENLLDYIQFIPCISPAGSEKELLSAEAYGKFMTDIFNRWYEDFSSGKEVHINFIDDCFQMLMGYPPLSCGTSGVCSYQFVIEADGGVYPCDFYVLDEYKLGNLKNNSFETINKKRSEIRFIEESYSLNIKCKNCKYFKLCRGGCKRYRNPDGLNVLCSGYIKFFDECLPILIDIIKSI
ncbi:MAG: anaerobic sulfatase maturase [Eubacterium sp.]|nr:anaerobic sulfatase maturase [Eubacterium sp.]MBR4242183.1 anaerobic sulfatase maturase [Eubacterium sp.]